MKKGPSSRTPILVPGAGASPTDININTNGTNPSSHRGGGGDPNPLKAVTFGNTTTFGET